MSPGTAAGIVSFAPVLLPGGGDGGSLVHATRPARWYVVFTSEAFFTQHSLSQPLPFSQNVAPAQDVSCAHRSQHAAAEATFPASLPLLDLLEPKSVSVLNVQPVLPPLSNADAFH